MITIKRRIRELEETRPLTTEEMQLISKQREIDHLKYMQWGKYWELYGYDKATTYIFEVDDPYLYNLFMNYYRDAFLEAYERDRFLLTEGESIEYTP